MSSVQNSNFFPVDAPTTEQGGLVSNVPLHDQHDFTSVNRSQVTGDVQHVGSVSQSQEPDPDLGAASASVQPVVELPAYPKTSSFVGHILNEEVPSTTQPNRLVQESDQHVLSFVVDDVSKKRY
ncbi:hypothetical protein V6N13_113538 [Hibiscus sabdariffa]